MIKNTTHYGIDKGNLVIYFLKVPIWILVFENSYFLENWYFNMYKIYVKQITHFFIKKKNQDTCYH